MNIIIISPTRNEDKYIHITIESMLNQTLLPIKWIIVNDGSIDTTEKIIKQYLKNVQFIELVTLPDRGYRKPGGGVVEAFYEGFKKIRNTDYDVIAKLDADLKFPSDTLAKIAQAFAENPKLGITGGNRYEKLTENGSLKRGLVPKGFVGGPYKFYRKKCFEDIGGLIPRTGWDGVDIVKANMNGWLTGEIESIKIIHLRPTGTSNGEGLIKAYEKDGDINYFMGGYFWYFILRILLRSLEKRDLKVGFYMLKGYLKSRQKKIIRESKEFRSYVRKIQRQNIIYWFSFAITQIKRYWRIKLNNK